MLWSSVPAAANANDTLVGGEKRRLIGLTINQSVPVPDMADVLRAYASVWLVPTSGGMRLLADADAAAAASYSHASGQIAALEGLTLRDLGNVPTVVDVIYTDASQVPYREAVATAQQAGAGTTSTSPSPSSMAASRGTMMRASSTPAGAETIEAVSTWAAAPGSTSFRIVA